MARHPDARFTQDELERQVRPIPGGPAKVKGYIAWNTSRDELVSLRIRAEHRGEPLVVGERLVSLAKRMNKHDGVSGSEAARLDERGDGPVHELVAGVGYRVTGQSKVRAEEGKPLAFALARRDVGLTFDGRGSRGYPLADERPERLGDFPLDRRIARQINSLTRGGLQP